MAATARTALSNIKTRIAGITTGGGFHYSLDGADQVVIASPIHPERVPAVYLDVQSVTSALAEGKTHLNAYTRTVVYGFLGFVASNTDSPSDRTLAAMDLLDDITARLEGDRGLSNTVFDLVVVGTAFDGAAEDLPSLGVVAGTITIWWRTAAGQGV